MKPQDPSAARQIFGAVAASGTEGIIRMLTISRTLRSIGQWIHRVFSMDVANTSLGSDAEIIGMCMQFLSSTMVQAGCSYVI